MSIPADAPDAIEPGDTTSSDPTGLDESAHEIPESHEQVDEENNPRPDVPGQHNL